MGLYCPLKYKTRAAADLSFYTVSQWEFMRCLGISLLSEVDENFDLLADVDREIRRRETVDDLYGYRSPRAFLRLSPFSSSNTPSDRHRTLPDRSTRKA